MRACFAVLLTVAAVSAFVGKHDGYIKSHLQLYDLDNYIVRSPISVPDTIINKYTLADTDVKKLLQDHVRNAAQRLVNIANQDPTKADAEVLHMPFPVSVKNNIGSQQAAKQAAAAWIAANPNAPGANIPQPNPNPAPAPAAGKKRSVEEVPKMDLAATMELYRQAADFLEKYDVELRFD